MSLTRREADDIAFGVLKLVGAIADAGHYPTVTAAPKPKPTKKPGRKPGTQGRRKLSPPIVGIDTGTWCDQANCRGYSADEMVPYPGEKILEQLALALCEGCPVKAECLADALEIQPPSWDQGIRGGMTQAERHKLPRKPRPIDHGTMPGYQMHRRRCEDPCQDCRDANRRYKARQS